jgi:nucleotide-binding universal stress UspA family protein
MFTFRHILVPTDFGSASNRALELALEMAEKFGSKLTLFHAYDVPVSYSEALYWPVDSLEAEARQALDDACTSAKARYPLVEAILGRGPAWEQTLDIARARGADLIVMGTHGRRGVSHVLLGSQAERVVRLSPVPVLTVSEGGERRALAHSHGAAAGAPAA